MNTGRFQLALRVWHPAEDPGVLTEVFERQPETAWAHDAVRIGANGSPLPGVHDRTYWMTEVASGRIADLVPALAKLAGELSSKREEIERLTDTGGRVECFVGWFEDGNSGVELDHELLRELADVGVNLALDVYGTAG